MASILLDQNVPGALRHLLPGHEVRTAFRMGWAALSNGALIAAAEAARFDVLLTADKNLRYQQNLAGRRIALVILGGNNWSVVQRNVDAIGRAVMQAGPATVQNVAFDHDRG